MSHTFTFIVSNINESRGTVTRIAAVSVNAGSSIATTAAAAVFWVFTFVDICIITTSFVVSTQYR